MQAIEPCDTLSSPDTLLGSSLRFRRRVSQRHITHTIELLLLDCAILFFVNDIDVLQAILLDGYEKSVSRDQRGFFDE